jgi:phospholipase C
MRYALFALAAACSAHPAHPHDAAPRDAAPAPAPAPDLGAADSAPDLTPPAPDLAPSCPSAPAPDPLAAQRASCSFAAGALPAATLGPVGALPIRHIVVVMKENRSFDHLFGGLAARQPAAEIFPPGFTNPDSSGQPVAPFHLGTTCVANDPDHQWQAMHAQVDSGKMDGYVTSAAASTGSDGHFAVGYYDETDLPFYYFLADTFAIADHYFPAVRSGTFPNRDYLLLGTSDKVTATQYTVWPDPTLPSLFDRLDAAQVSWGVFADDHPLEETLNDPAHDWETLHPWKSVQTLLDEFAADTVPSVVFVDGTENIQDEHPTADLQVGEAWTKRLYDAAIASAAWPSTVLLLTYDESGGFFDHVPPPSNACVARPVDSAFFELGTRVPLLAVSPWARRHYVSKSVHSHTSITRFVEAVFGLPALTARDANSDGLLDLFDFACAPSPLPAAPAAGTGGCKGPTIALSKTSYAVGEAVVVSFTNGPGNAKDWIGVYPKGTSPHPGSTIWQYVNGTHTATTGVTQGTVQLGAGSGTWPLTVGQWMAYYLVNDGYTSIASVEFDVK